MVFYTYPSRRDMRLIKTILQQRPTTTLEVDSEMNRYKLRVRFDKK
jgi:hypothetical protein